MLTSLPAAHLHAFFRDMHELTGRLGVHVTSMMVHARDWNVSPGQHLKIRVASSTLERLQVLIQGWEGARVCQTDAACEEAVLLA